MTHWTRPWAVAAATVFALAAVPGAIVTIHAPGIANADVFGERRTTGICEWLREHRRRSCALRSAAGLLRAHAVRPTAAPERQRVCQLQRPVDQRRRLQLGRLLTATESHRQADEFSRWWVAWAT